MLPVVVILTAISEEYEAVRAYLTQLTNLPVEGTYYEKGLFKAEQPVAEVIIRQCGQSNVNAAAETERAIHAFQPDYMFFVGIAGGRKDVTIGDVVFGSKIYYYEVQKLAAAGAKYRPDQASSTYEIEEIVKLAQRSGEWTRWIKGRNKRYSARIGAIASGEKLIDDQTNAVAQDIDVHFNDTLAVEMEGFGFGSILHKQGGRSRQIFSGVFRGISDLVNAPAHSLPPGSKRPAGAKQLASRTAAALAYWTLFKHTSSKKKGVLVPLPTAAPNFLTDETASLVGVGREVIGRQSEASTLKQELDLHDKVVVVNGVGGIGKTTLAKLYLDTYADEYTNVLWLNGASGIEKAFINFDLIKQLNLFDEVSSLPPSQLFNQVIDKLKALQPRYNLLILDNVDRKLEKWLSEKIQLRPNWKVLLTSRISFSGYKQYLLQALSEEDCLRLFFTHYTKESRDLVREALVKRIIKAVFHHTLTLELLAKTTQANRAYTLEKLYVTLQQEGLSKQLDVAIQVPAYNRLKQRLNTTINDCLQIAFSVAEIGSEPLKRELLTYLSVLPPIQINYSVLTKLFRISPDNETKFQNALTFLVERGWLEETLVDSTHFIYMHPVIQLTLRKKLKPTATKISGLLGELMNLVNTESYETRSVEELLLYTPFIESVIEYLPAIDPAVAALYESYARLSREIFGNREKALDYSWRAYRLRKERFPADAVTLAASANGLAIELRFKRDFTNALSLSQEAIATLERIPQPSAELLKTLATYYQNQGQILRGLGQTQPAIDQFKKSMALLADYQLEHPHLVAAANNNIGLVYNNQLNDYKLALPYYQEAVRLAEASRDVKVYHYYNNLADCLIDNGRLLEALNYQHRVVEQYEKAPGKEKNIYLAIAYKVLSDIYAALGGDNNLSSALTYQNQAIFIKRNVENPVSLAVSLTAMAKLYRAGSSHKDLAKAIDFQQQANELFIQQDDPQIITGLDVLLDLFVRCNDWSAARQTYEDLLKQAQRFRTPEFVQTLITRWQQQL